jgi:hypothetical protein
VLLVPLKQRRYYIEMSYNKIDRAHSQAQHSICKKKKDEHIFLNIDHV